MMKRLTAILLAIITVLPVLCFVNATMPRQTPFAEYDNLREQAVLESLSQEERRFTASCAFSAEKNKNDTNRYIVRFDDSLSDSSLFSLLENYDYTPLSQSEQRVFLLSIADISAFEKENRNRTLYIEPDNALYTLAVTDDPMIADCAAYEDARVFDAWDLGFASDEVIVAVLDTGIDRSHEDFAGVTILPGYDTQTRKSGVSADQTGHGTAVCGIIASAANNKLGFAGIAHGVKLLPVKVTSSYERIYSSDLIGGLRFAADAGASVINMSFGGLTSSAAEKDAVDYAIEKGCILIAAAGNSGNTVYAESYCYPASYDGVISVGALDDNGDVSSFSQKNDSVDVSAPGENILVPTVKDGVSGYKTDSGSSYSCAIVSAIAALAKSKIDSSARFEGAEFLSLIASLGGSRLANVGYGLINAFAVVSNVNMPIITGVASGESYSTRVTLGFNRGEAVLNGVSVRDGFTVVQNGVHTLTVTDGSASRSVTFRVNYKPITYAYKSYRDYVTFVFDRGEATLDGFPYASGTKITVSGKHDFILSDEYGETLTKTVTPSFEPPEIYGVENGEDYTSAVHIRTVGAGRCYLNGEEFSDSAVAFENGEYEVRTVSLSGAERKLTFNISTDAYIVKTEIKDCRFIVDEKYGYFAVYGESLVGIRVYSQADNGKYLYFYDVGEVFDYALCGDYLYLRGENGITALNRADILKQNPQKTLYQAKTSTALVSVNGNAYTVINDALCVFDQSDGSFVTLYDYKDTPLLLCANGTQIIALLSGVNDKICFFDTQTNEYDENMLPNGIFNKQSSGLLCSEKYTVCGNTVYGNNDGNAVCGFTASEIVAIKGDTLYTDSYVINVQTGAVIGTYPDKLCDILFTDNGVWCFFENGLLYRTETTGFYADYTDVLLGSAKQSSALGMVAPITANDDFVGSVAYGDSVFAVYKPQALAVIDCKTLAVTKQMPLLFVPQAITVSEGMICVMFEDASYLYTAPAESPENGVYIETNATDAVYSNGYLCVISDNKVSLMSDGVTQELSVFGERLFSDGDTLFVSYGSAITEIFTFDLTIPPVTITLPTAANAIFADENYIFAGRYVISRNTGALSYHIAGEALAVIGNTLVAENGVYNLANGEVIAEFNYDSEVCMYSEGFGFVFMSKTLITSTECGFDLTIPPVISGAEDGGSYEGEVTIKCDYPVCYVDTALATGNISVVSGAFEHSFTAVYPCRVYYKIRFRITEKLSGIEIIGNDRKINVNESLYLRVSYLPVGASSVQLLFSSDNDAVSVDENGKITGNREGSAVITVKTADGRFTDKVTVYVSKALILFTPESGYVVDREDGLILGVMGGTVAREVLAAIITESDGGASIIMESNGKTVSGIVKTGDSFVLKNNNGEVVDTLHIVINGDVDCDGYVTAGDCAALEELIRDNEADFKELRSAGDINYDGDINIIDLELLQESLLNSQSSKNKRAPEKREYGGTDIFLPSVVYAGETVTVTLSLDNCKNSNGVSGVLTYNKNLLAFKSYSLLGAEGRVVAEDGNASFFVFLDFGKYNERLLYTFITFTFDVSEQAADAQIEFALSDVTVSFKNGAKTLAENKKSVVISKREYKELDIRIGNINGFVFKPDVYEYNVSAIYTVVTVDLQMVYPQGASYTVGNTVIPDSDKLTLLIHYVDENGETSFYTVNITREEAPVFDENCSLATLTVSDFLLSPEFEGEVTEYIVYVPHDTQSVNVACRPESDKARYDVSKSELVDGENIITVTVTAESGAKKTYTVTVIRAFPPVVSEPPAVRDNNYIAVYIAVAAIPVILCIALVLVALKRKKNKNSVESEKTEEK